MRPVDFATCDHEKRLVIPLPMRYPGPTDEVKKIVPVWALMGPIEQMDNGEFRRYTVVNLGQNCDAFNQALIAIWRPELKWWTIDHPTVNLRNY